MADVKLPKLPHHPIYLDRLGGYYTKKQMREYAEKAVRQALENQERVCCVETDQMGVSTFTKHNLPPSKGLVGLAIIPLPEGL